ncbi:hypothetical protein RRSWK_04174 [Rhodopirellula sp. SWK7]|nr:hypothetical protein RRSWK_04174 [Rhodopirellula sp. SWK7]
MSLSSAGKTREARSGRGSLGTFADAKIRWLHARSQSIRQEPNHLQDIGIEVISAFHWEHRCNRCE